VLLVVGQAADRLIVYPAPRLDELLAGSQRTLFGGAQ
jgi:hypothetical protein